MPVYSKQLKGRHIWDNWELGFSAAFSIWHFSGDMGTQAKAGAKHRQVSGGKKPCPQAFVSKFVTHGRSKLGMTRQIQKGFSGD